MLKTLFVLSSSLLLFSATLDALPSEKSDSLLNHSQEDNRIVSQKRRRSSLFGGNAVPRSERPLAVTENGSTENSSYQEAEESSLQATSEVEISFDTQLKHYESAIVEASARFESLAKQLQGHLARKTADISIIRSGGDGSSFYSDYLPNEERSETERSRSDVSALQFPQQDGSLNHSIEFTTKAGAGDQSLSSEVTAEIDSLFDDLTTESDFIFSQTHYYTELLLKKIIELEIEHPEAAAENWTKIVEHNKAMIERLEEYHSICKESFSDKEDILSEIEGRIALYDARLEEYEAEQSATDIATTYHDYTAPNLPQQTESFSESVHSLSQPLDDSKTEALKGTHLLYQDSLASLTFHNAAEKYRKIIKHSDDSDINKLYEVMALWCEARAAEIDITAAGHTSLVHGTSFIDEAPLIEKASKAFSAIIKISEELQTTFKGNEDFEPECMETARYLQEARTRKLLIEAQFQKRKFDRLLKSPLATDAALIDQMTYHKNVLTSLQDLQEKISKGTEDASERLKSLWDQFDGISSSISSTTESLKQKIVNLITAAKAEAERATDLQQSQSEAEPISSTQFLLSLDHGSATPTTTRPIVSSHEIISAAKTTFEKYKTALQVAKEFPDLLPATDSIKALQTEQNYWNAASIKFQTDHHNTQAVHWIELSKESVGKTKSALLEKASQEIAQAVRFCNQLSESITQIYSDKSIHNKTVPITQEESLEYKKNLEAKQTEIQKALEESRKPSWASWFCSFFKLPQWFYFWRSASTV